MDRPRKPPAQNPATRDRIGPAAPAKSAGRFRSGERGKAGGLRGPAPWAIGLAGRNGSC
jgi:hypothetical protein